MIRNLFFYFIFAQFFNTLLTADGEPKCYITKHGNVPAIRCKGQLGGQPLNINQWLKDTAKNNTDPSAIREIALIYGNTGFETRGNEFDGFPNLEDIDITLYHSRRTNTLHPRTFANLPKLRSLNLEGFNLVADPDSAPLEPLYKSLKWLKIIDSNVGERPDIFRNFQNLDEVALHSTGIKTLPQDAFDKSAKKIKIFKVTNSTIETIKSATFSDFYSLEELDLGNNQISSIENGAFENLHNLKMATLKNNKLQYLPTGLFKNAKLCKLALEGNPSAEVVKQSFGRPGCTVSSALRPSGTLLFVVSLVVLACML